MRQLLVGALVGYLAAFITMASPRLWQLARWAPAAALLGQSSTALSLGGDKRVPLASSVRGRNTPTTVLVHGLDSSKQTWHAVLPKLHEAGLPALALDQRGHGESPLGDPETFSTEALARDVIHAVEVQHGVQRPWILVGHSMGGRVAMAVAAISAREAPDRLAAVVVEDMDCRNREKWGPQPQESEEIEEFDREFASESDAVAALEKHYEADRVQGWLGSRVRPIAGGGYWSDVNPQAQQLARANVLACDAASSNWDALASHKELPFPVHLWIGGPTAFGGTVVDWDGRDGIRDMQKRLPAVHVRAELLHQRPCVLQLVERRRIAQRRHPAPRARSDEALEAAQHHQLVHVSPRDVGHADQRLGLQHARRGHQQGPRAHVRPRRQRADVLLVAAHHEALLEPVGERLLHRRRRVHVLDPDSRHPLPSRHRALMVGCCCPPADSSPG